MYFPLERLQVSKLASLARFPYKPFVSEDRKYLKGLDSGHFPVVQLLPP